MILNTRTVEKPWGCDALPAPFVAPAGLRIGEVWFEPPPQMPGLLVKYIFTSEKLSVQVHPSDAQTIVAGLGRQGKEECWLVLAAEPGARLGVGFREQISAEAMRAAALDGSIEHLLEWHAVRPGDFFMIPANTVHAIGAGISLVEIQQNSEITYRLYDYGRPRDLHLDAAVAVASGAPHDPALRHHVPQASAQVLVDGAHFRLEQVAGVPDMALSARFPGALLVIPLDGAVTVAGEQVLPGQCALAECYADIAFAANGRCLLAAATV